jgi:large subunit ribosomal protein L5e
LLTSPSSYADAHAKIREDPFLKEEGDGPKKTKEEWKKESLKYRQTKLSKEEKTKRVQAKIQELKSQ